MKLTIIILIIGIALVSGIAGIKVGEYVFSQGRQAMNLKEIPEPEVQYNDPTEIPDCEYLTGSYVIGAKQIKGSTLGYMICAGNKPYHYEMILENTTSKETYWVKKDGGRP